MNAKVIERSRLLGMALFGCGDCLALDEDEVDVLERQALLKALLKSSEELLGRGGFPGSSPQLTLHCDLRGSLRTRGVCCLLAELEL
jgi:hypothetical protein